jgi:hypothetical protein
MKVMKVRSAMLAILIGAAALPARAREHERLSMRVSPSVAFAPANLIVRAIIPAAAENRAVEISAESPEFYRSSEVQLDGDRAPRTSVFEFRSLPPGSYEVKATLRGSAGEELASVITEVNVIASGGGPN